MYPFHRPDGRELSADDVAGICELYPTAECEPCAEGEECVDGVCVNRCEMAGCPGNPLCQMLGCAPSSCPDCPTGVCDPECDAAPVAEWGAPCESASDCHLGACHEDGYCSTACVDASDCPDGWRCPAAGICERDGLVYGEACDFSTDCVSSSCIETSDADGAFCSVPCASDASCPSGDECRTGTPGSYCVPATRLGGGCSVIRPVPATRAVPLAVMAILLTLLAVRRSR